MTTLAVEAARTGGWPSDSARRWASSSLSDIRSYGSLHFGTQSPPCSRRDLPSVHREEFHHIVPHMRDVGDEQRPTGPRNPTDHHLIRRTSLDEQAVRAEKHLRHLRFSEVPLRMIEENVPPVAGGAAIPGYPPIHGAQYIQWIRDVYILKESGAE